MENQVWGAGTEWKNAQTIRAKSLTLEGRAASRSRQSDPPLGLADQRALETAAGGLHLSSQGSVRIPRQQAGPTKGSEKTFLTAGVRTRRGTYGVHLSLYSLAMVSMPPLLATAM